MFIDKCRHNKPLKYQYSVVPKILPYLIQISKITQDEVVQMKWQFFVCLFVVFPYELKRLFGYIWCTNRELRIHSPIGALSIQINFESFYGY